MFLFTVEKEQFFPNIVKHKYDLALKRGLHGSYYKLDPIFGSAKFLEWMLEDGW